MVALDEDLGSLNPMDDEIGVKRSPGFLDPPTYLRLARFYFCSCRSAGLRGQLRVKEDTQSTGSALGRPLMAVGDQGKGPSLDSLQRAGSVPLCSFRLVP